MFVNQIKASVGQCQLDKTQRNAKEYKEGFPHSLWVGNVNNFVQQNLSAFHCLLWHSFESGCLCKMHRI